LGIGFLLFILKGISTVQYGNPFFMNIKEALIFMNIEMVLKNVPVVFTSVGSCGVALLRSLVVYSKCAEKCREV
jgi:hypothetical protein